VREVLSAVVHVPRGEMAGHAFERVSAISENEADVRFRLRLLGIPVETLERVRADETGVHFQLLRGYLPAVEEHMAVVAEGADSVVRYSGRYQTRPGLFGRLLGPVLVPPIYRREVRRSLLEMKRRAEERQAHSAMYRRPA